MKTQLMAGIRHEGSQLPDKDKCRIVFITAVGATQFLFLRGQNAFLAKHGFEIHAIASPGKLLDQLFDRDGVYLHPVPISRRLTPLADALAVVRIFRVLRKVKPDIVHVSTPKAALVGALAASAARVPATVFLVRGLLTPSARGAQRWLMRWAERLTARLCHRVICNSESLLEFAREEGVLSRSQGIVLGSGMSNGIDVTRFAPRRVEPAVTKGGLPDGHSASDQHPVVGFVGRLNRDKGIEELATAWRLLRNSHPGVRLLLVGGWETDNPVPRNVRLSLENDERVCVTGFVSDVARHYRAMSVFVFPSHREGFPNAPMEAAAMELPVVATRAVGNVDAVQDGVTGTLVPPRNSFALAAAVRRYLQNPELRRQHGRAGRKRVLREFRSEHIWESTLQEYRSLLRARGLPLPDVCESRSSSREAA